MEIVFIKPNGVEDCGKCISVIKDNKILHINLSDVGNDNARRIIHYLSGAMFMQDGILYSPADKIFCTIPKGVKYSSLSPEDDEPEITIDR
ncbi:MAG: cell division protein SepF [Fusobacteriaceae bacterium]|jgi:cell division inhibitor SepF|nr:cell division protein SepF [Fusobacteriaceae bacterium]